MFSGQRVRPIPLRAPPPQQMVSIPPGLPQAFHLSKGDLSQEAGLSAPSVSSNTSVPHCLRITLGFYAPPIPSSTHPLPLPPPNKNGGQKVSG